MARVQFTPHLMRHLDCPSCEVVAGSVRDALEAVFADNPRLRGYVMDDQNRVRRHIAIFVDGHPLRNHNDLSDPLAADSELFVMQALSGG